MQPLLELGPFIRADKDQGAAEEGDWMFNDGGEYKFALCAEGLVDYFNATHSIWSLYIRIYSEPAPGLVPMALKRDDKLLIERVLGTVQLTSWMAKRVLGTVQLTSWMAKTLVDAEIRVGKWYWVAALSKDTADSPLTAIGSWQEFVE